MENAGVETTRFIMMSTEKQMNASMVIMSIIIAREMIIYALAKHKRIMFMRSCDALLSNT